MPSGVIRGDSADDMESLERLGEMEGGRKRRGRPNRARRPEKRERRDERRNRCNDPRERSPPPRRSPRGRCGLLRQLVHGDPRVGDVVESHLRIALEASAEHATHRGRRVRRQRRPIDVSAEHRGERVGDGFSIEGLLSGEHFVENRAEQPDVRPPVHGLPSRLLRRHEGGRADDDARLCGLRRKRRGVRDVRRGGVPRESLSEPEVEHLDRAARSDHDVGRLQVTVDDPFLMYRFQGFRHLPCDRQRLLGRNRTAGEPFGESLALDELQHERRDAAELLETVDPANVWDD